MGGQPENSEKPRCVIVEVYDTTTNMWSTKNSMPFKSACLMGFVIDDKIFCIEHNMVYMYNPVTDTWTHKPDAPYYLFSPAAAAVDNKIILAGNFIISQALPIQYGIIATVYDMETDTWIKGEVNAAFTSDGAVAGATTGISSQKVYFFSGTGDNMIYEPATDTWSAAKSMPSVRSAFGVVTLDDVLYVIGGYDRVSGTKYATTEQYVPNGYNDAISGPSNSSTSTSPNDNTIIIVVVLVILTVGIVVALLIVTKKSSNFKNLEKESFNELGT